MPKFFFNVHDGISSPDPAGVELPNWHAAKIEAVRRAAQLLEDQARYIAIGDDWCLDVMDERCTHHIRLNFIVARTPSV